MADTPDAPPLETTARTPSRRTWAIVGSGLAVFTALVVYASLPTGTDDAASVVPDGSRLAASEAVDDVVVHLLSDAGRLRIQIAYDSVKGWLEVVLDHRDADVVAARTSTPGSGPVPALTAVYGRAPGDEVTVVWDDGTETLVVPASDGVYLAARRGVHDVGSVVVRRAGEPVVEVQRP